MCFQLKKRTDSVTVTASQSSSQCTSAPVRPTSVQIDLDEADDEDDEVIHIPVPTHEAFPSLYPTTVPAKKKASTKSSTVSSAEGSAPKAAAGDAENRSVSDILELLAQKTTDTDELKRKVDQFLNSLDPQVAEQSSWGSWLSTCAQQIPRNQWADFTDQSYQLIRRFLPGANFQPPQRVPPSYVSAPQQQPQPTQQQSQQQAQQPPAQQQQYGHYGHFSQYGQYAQYQQYPTAQPSGSAATAKAVPTTDTGNASTSQNPSFLSPQGSSLSTPNLSLSSDTNIAPGSGSFMAALTFDTDNLQQL